MSEYDLVQKGENIPEITGCVAEGRMFSFICDDIYDTNLRLMQDGQGDVWITIASSKPEIFKTVRFRTKQGGGSDENMKFRHFLAKFINGRLDAAEPQPTEREKQLMNVIVAYANRFTPHGSIDSIYEENADIITEARKEAGE